MGPGWTEIPPAVVVAVLALLAALTTLRQAWLIPFRRLTGALAVVAAAAVLLGRFVPGLLPFKEPLFAPGLMSGVLVPACAAALFVLGWYRLLYAPRNAAALDLGRVIRNAAALVADSEVSRTSPRRRPGLPVVPLDASLTRRGKTRHAGLDRSLRRASRGRVRRHSEAMTLLVGTRGAGKSAAMRRLARGRMPGAQRAVPGVRVPVYVDLSRLDATKPVSVQTLREHVATLLADSDPLLDETVLKYLRESRDTVRWTLLFDGFDEIPALASATDLAHAQEMHVRAIRRFVGSLPHARAVVAGRSFGETTIVDAAATIRVQPLRPRRQRRLVRAAGLRGAAARRLRQRLRTDPTIRSLADTPFTLGVLCEYVAAAPDALPQTLFESFDRAIEARLTGAGGPHLHTIAKQLAFCVTLDAQPNGAAWSRLAERMTRYGFATAAEARAATPALMAAGIITVRMDGTEVSSVAFTHRLFQDCLAAGAIIARPDLATGPDILGERWREVVPLVLRHGPPEARDLLFAEVRALLAAGLSQVPGLLARVDVAGLDRVTGLRERFAWPQPTAAMLIMLAAVCRGGTVRVPPDVSRDVDRLVVSAFLSGATYDWFVALDVLPLADTAVAAWAVDHWSTFANLPALQVGALTEAAVLPELPIGAASRIRLSFLREALNGRRAWYHNPLTPSVSQPVGLRVLSAIAAGMAAVFALRAVVDLTRPAFGGEKHLGEAAVFGVLAVAALLWWHACRGATVPPSLLTAAASLYGLVVFVYGCALLLMLSRLPWDVLLARGRGVLDASGWILGGLAVLWPALAVLAAVDGGSRREVLLRPDRVIRRFLRRRLRERGIADGLVVVVAVFGFALLGILTVDAEGSAYLPERAAPVVTTVLRWVLLVTVTVCFVVTLYWNELSDLAWRRRNELADLDAVTDAQLRSMLRAVPHQRSLGWLLDGLERRSEDHPPLLAGAAALLFDLDHALDHLGRTMPPGSAWSVQATAWDDVRPFRDPEFVAFLRDPALARDKLCWLTRYHRERVARLRRAAEQAGTRDGSPTAPAVGLPATAPPRP
ncbi:NACHT domain-containing protein [Actinoplanes sp. NPDC051346]|uniref:NACHT domain-containing protein n=1 Tax=Actinoplanes sp. NPDC051346 TaxID=3155048 RepID=UPI00341686BE